MIHLGTIDWRDKRYDISVNEEGWFAMSGADETGLLFHIAPNVDGMHAAMVKGTNQIWGMWDINGYWHQIGCLLIELAIINNHPFHDVYYELGSANEVTKTFDDEMKVSAGTTPREEIERLKSDVAAVRQESNAPDLVT